MTRNRRGRRCPWMRGFRERCAALAFVDAVDAVDQAEMERAWNERRRRSRSLLVSSWGREPRPVVVQLSRDGVESRWMEAAAFFVQGDLLHGRAAAVCNRLEQPHPDVAGTQEQGVSSLSRASSSRPGSRRSVLSTADDDLCPRVARRRFLSRSQSGPDRLVVAILITAGRSLAPVAAAAVPASASDPAASPAEGEVHGVDVAPAPVAVRLSLALSGSAVLDDGPPHLFDVAVGR